MFTLFLILKKKKIIGCGGSLITSPCSFVTSVPQALSVWREMDFLVLHLRVSWLRASSDIMGTGSVRSMETFQMPLTSFRQLGSGESSSQICKFSS